MVNGIVSGIRECKTNFDSDDNKILDGVKSFVEDTIQSIVNYKKVLDGKPRQVKFSSRQIRMALSM